MFCTLKNRAISLKNLNPQDIRGNHYFSSAIAETSYKLNNAGFFSLMLYFRDSSMLLYVVIIGGVFHWINILRFIYPFSWYEHLGCFQFSAIMNEAA